MQTLAACIVLFIKEGTAYLPVSSKRGLKKRKKRGERALGRDPHQGRLGEFYLNQAFSFVSVSLPEVFRKVYTSQLRQKQKTKSQNQKQT